MYKRQDLDEDALEFLADMAGGDARTALNAIELGILTTQRSDDGRIHITLSLIHIFTMMEVMTTEVTTTEVMMTEVTAMEATTVVSTAMILQAVKASAAVIIAGIKTL